MLGSRTRPASFGRASTWSETPSSPIAGNTVQMYPEMSTTPSTRPSWATMSSWTPQRHTEADKSTTWYPAAGSQLSNEVEEPNQQGLTKPRNEGIRIGHVLGLTVMAVIMTSLC